MFAQETNVFDEKTKNIFFFGKHFTKMEMKHWKMNIFSVTDFASELNL